MQKRFANLTNTAGDAVSGGTVTVTTYPGGSTALIYRTNDATGTAISNGTLTTDSKGYYEYYAPNGHYSETYSGTGISTYTISDITCSDDSSLALAALAASSGSSLVGLLDSATGAVATNVSAYVNTKVKSLKGTFGCVGDGVTDDTTKLQNAFSSGKILEDDAGGTYLFTTLSFPAETEFRGAGPNHTIFNTVTSGNAVSLAGHRIHLMDLALNQTSGSKQGKGLVGSDKYWFRTERIIVNGFDYDLYCDKSLYHSHKDSRFTGGNNGLYYWGNAGNWNSAWYNNQIVLENIVAFGLTYGCYFKGAGLGASVLDVSSSGTGLYLLGDSASYPSHGNTIGSLYSELTDTVLKMGYATAQLTSGYVQGGAGVGTPKATPFNLDNSSLIISGHLRGIDYWTNRYVLTNSSRLESNQTPGLGGVYAGTSVDATSAAFVTDYEEGTFTGTLTGCTTSPTATISYAKQGKLVTVSIPSLSATSNTTACTITGLPAIITPANNQLLFANVFDSGANFTGLARFDSAGIITFFKTNALGVFTNSGVKGVQGTQSLTYPLY